MNTHNMSHERITDRDDLDDLLDDETILRTPEERARRAILVALIAAALIVFMVVANSLFAPEGQIVMEHWPNGYTKTETTYRSKGRGREAHGAFRSWYESGRLLSQGEYIAGQREGEWVIYQPDGTVDEDQSGNYVNGERVGP